MARTDPAHSPVEIERKFLVQGSSWKQASEALSIRQGYFASGTNGVVRIRRQDQRGFLTIKGRIEGLTRTELEYEIPVDDAETLLSMCQGRLIEKTRHVVFHAGKKWEIDVFEGPNAGLVVAEIELEAEDEAFERPEWLGEEVSSDHRYANSHLSQSPYSEWDR